jgi:hypothetical protein
MNTSILIHLTTALLFVCGASQAAGQSTAFTYQGRLQHGGLPANGLYEMVFALYDAPTNGNLVIRFPRLPAPVGSVPVSNGLFTATLDFGAFTFPGEDRWLEVLVTPAGSGQQPTPLHPRQPLTASPYAIRAAHFSGPIADGQLSANVARLDADQVFSGRMTFERAFVMQSTQLVSNLNAQLFHGLSITNLQLKAELSGFTGAENTVLGRNAAIFLPPNGGTPSGGGYMNTVVGYEALRAADFAHRTTAVGRGALRDCATGWLNVAVGTDAGRHTVLGHRNTFIGSNAGKWVGSLNPQADDHPVPDAPAADNTFDYGADLPDQGSRNTLIGRNAGHLGTQIQSCVAVGYNAGALWLRNDATTAVGRNALIENTEASGTVAVGAFAMDGSTAGGNHSVAIGFEALRQNSANNNVAIGAFAGETSDGGQNVFIGEQCAGQKQTGSDNVFIGRLAGEANTDGSGNIFLGRMAGRFEPGSNKLIIHNTSSTAPFLKGSMGDAGLWWLDVRGDVRPNEDGAWSLGSLAQRWNRLYAVNGTISTSDGSLKTAVQEDDLGLEFIRVIRPRNIWVRWRRIFTRPSGWGRMTNTFQASMPTAWRWRRYRGSTRRST